MRVSRAFPTATPTTLTPRHFTCRVPRPWRRFPGDGGAGVDLGVSNIADVAFPDEYVLYPGNVISRIITILTAKYGTEGDNGPSQQAQRLRQKRSRRETHFYESAPPELRVCIYRTSGRALPPAEASLQRLTEPTQS